MANVIGTLTINQSKFLELDASPFSSPTSGIEIGDFCMVDGISGVWQKTGSGTYDFSRVDSLSSVSVQAAAAGTLNLSNTSANIQVFTGAASGQVVKLPDATTLGSGFRFEIWNKSSQVVAIQDNSAAAIASPNGGEVTTVILTDNTSVAGVWRYVTIPLPSGGGGVTYGSPVALAPDSGNVDGVATSVARSDHQHNLPADAPTTNLSATTTNSEGTGTSVARNDHTHAISTGAASAQTPDQVNAAGTSANLARADHVHNIPTGTPSTIGTANSQGSAAAFARQDHVHAHGAQTDGTLHAVATTSVNGFMSSTDKTKLDASGILTSTAPVDVTKAAAAVGVSTETARADHKHDITTAAASGLAATTINAEGTATSLARSDHTHAISTGVVSTQTPDQTNAAGTNANLARADHVHNIPTGVPSTISTANSQGTAAAFARQDHVHSHGAQTDGTLHAVATTSVAGFMSASDKTKLDALKTRSGRVTAVTFTGTPKKATVSFTAFSPATTNYSITVTGADARTWTYESKTNSSFVINANANAALTGEVSWQIQLDGEVG